MIHFRHTVSRLATSAVLAIGRFFEPKLDRLVVGFTKLDGSLARFMERQYARAAAEQDVRRASNARQQAAAEAEHSVRVASHNREDLLHDEIARAQRIRSAVQALIGG